MRGRICSVIFVIGAIVGSTTVETCRYNRGRPHASLGPGIPDPLSLWKQPVSTGHRLAEHSRVIATPILGGLHHEYYLAQAA